MLQKMFSERECLRCGAVILSGVVDGVGYRLDTKRVCEEDVKVLYHFGYLAIRLVEGVEGFMGTPFLLEHEVLSDKDLLLVQHVCGSDHARASQKELISEG